MRGRRRRKREGREIKMCQEEEEAIEVLERKGERIQNFKKGGRKMRERRRKREGREIKMCAGGTGEKESDISVHMRQENRNDD